MSIQNFPDNVLYEMDNLLVLQGMNSETIDLIATDPPFNTKRNRADTAGYYVDNWKYGDTGILPDQWKWNEVHPKCLEEIQDGYPELYHAIESTRLIQGEDTAAFLCFMSVRLIEMHRILKHTGSIYVHCDKTINSYLRIVMDAIFGKKNFRNEIIWQRALGRAKGSQHESKSLGQDTDNIFHYSKSDSYIHNAVTQPLTGVEMIEKFPMIDENGRRYNTNTPIFRQPSMGARPNLCYEYKGVVNPYSSGWRVSKDRLIEMDKAGYIIWREGKRPLRKAYADEYKGKPIGSLWLNISIAAGNERVNSPDQKPLALYERMIKASSEEGDIVLDPFCGCATTIIAANNLKRRWIGIDRRPDARLHIVTRLYFSEQDRTNENQGKKPIPKKERERIKKQAEEYPGWLDKQTARYEMHYQTKPPKRTDNGEQGIAELPAVYSAEPKNPHTREEMKNILIAEFGAKCWGCGFQPTHNDDRYLHLDHINPKSGGGLNTIDNRSILCQPCNSAKSNTMTLVGLRKQNKREKRLKKPERELIDIPSAVQWTSKFLIEHREKNAQQRKLDI